MSRAIVIQSNGRTKVTIEIECDEQVADVLNNMKELRMESMSLKINRQAEAALETTTFGSALATRVLRDSYHELSMELLGKWSGPAGNTPAPGVILQSRKFKFNAGGD